MWIPGAGWPTRPARSGRLSASESPCHSEELHLRCTHICICTHVYSVLKCAFCLVLSCPPRDPTTQGSNK